MSLPLVILRPREGGNKTAASAVALGLEPIVDPLFRIEPVNWTPPAASSFDALMVTSANAFHHGGNHLMKYQKLPVLAIGSSTGAVAQQFGFQVRKTGEGGAQSLVDSLQEGQYSRILRLVGEDHVSLKASGHDIETCVVYRSAALSLGPKAQKAMATDSVVLLHSVRAALLMADECDRLNIDCSNCHVAALSGNVSEAAGTGWANVHVSQRPTDDALLSLASSLCLGQ